jgi:Zn-dependent M28 family amino/carboxypeptidase
MADGNTFEIQDEAITNAATASIKGATTPKGGIDPAGDTVINKARPGCVHTGGLPATATAEGVNSTPVVTEIYYSELFVPCDMTVTGISVFNGSVASDDWHRALLDADGALVAGSPTGAVTSSGTDVYQKVPFTGGAITVKGPATYYVAQICDGTTDRYNTHGTATTGLGFPTNLVAGKVTSQTYGAIPATNTLTLTYTTNLGPIASLY